MSFPAEKLESPRQLAERLGWPLARVRKLIRLKQLRHVKVGGLYFIPSGAMDEFFEAQTIEPAPTPNETASSNTFSDR